MRPLFSADSPSTWIAAFDAVVLISLTDLMRWIGGEERLFVNWALRHAVAVDLLKLGVPVLAAFWVWTRPSGFAADPVRVLRQVAGVVLGMATGRGAQILLPERPRPFQAMEEFPFPDLGHLPWIADGSSMPSDHAALAFGLATVAWLGSRRLGTAALLWAALVVCMPRLYFGYHYLSDLVVGALVGIAAVWIASRAPLPSRVIRSWRRWTRWLDARAPGLATVCLSLIAFECLTLFQSSRTMANAAATIAVAVLRGPKEIDGVSDAPAQAVDAAIVAANDVERGGEAPDPASAR